MSRIDVSPEMEYKTSRSGGKGGQNVNKTETKVEAKFHIMKSLILTEEQKDIIVEKLANKIDSEGYLSVYCQVTRSQLANKDLATQGLNELISKALVKKKLRIPTKMNKAIKEAILQNKKKKSEVKQLRQKIRY